MDLSPRFHAFLQGYFIAAVQCGNVVRKIARIVEHIAQCGAMSYYAERHNLVRLPGGFNL
jgi:hypothetical protein